MNTRKATFQYFYCTKLLGNLPNPDVPTRDVTNTHGAGNKTEPHLELKIENMCKCRARIVTSAVKRALADKDEQHYLLLTTRHPKSGAPCIVGVMPFSRKAYGRLMKRIPDRWSEDDYLPYPADSEMKLVSFKEAYPLPDSIQPNGHIAGGQGGKSIVPVDLLNGVIKHFSRKKDRTQDFLANVKALEKLLKRDDPAAWDRYKGSISRNGSSCRKASTCN